MQGHNDLRTNTCSQPMLRLTMVVLSHSQTKVLLELAERAWEEKGDTRLGASIEFTVLAKVPKAVVATCMGKAGKARQASCCPSRSCLTAEGHLMEGHSSSYTFAHVTTYVARKAALQPHCHARASAPQSSQEFTSPLHCSQGRNGGRSQSLQKHMHHQPHGPREAEHQLHNSLHALLPSVPYLLAALDSAWQARAAYRPEMGGAACGAATPAAP